MLYEGRRGIGARGNLALFGGLGLFLAFAYKLMGRCGDGQPRAGLGATGVVEFDGLRPTRRQRVERTLGGS